MPRAPSYNPNQIGPAQITDARFRAADSGAGQTLARAGQRLSGALGQYAADEDARQEHYADTFARKLALDYKKSARPLVGEYLTTQGEAAITGGPSSQAKLKELRTGLEAQASNPRMKARLAELLDAEDMDFYEAMSSHSRKAQFTLDDNTAKSEAALAADDAAANFGNPDLVKKRLGEGLAALDRRGSLNGWSSAQMDVEKRDYVSNVHTSSLQAMLAQADPDVEMAAAYYSAHKGEMTAKDQVQVAGMLQKPLEFRQTLFDWQELTSGIKPVEGGPSPKTDPWAGVAVGVAQRFGMDPVEVGAIMSYETAGTFSPTIMGGKDGKYMGLIQFGEWERKKYGITKASTPADWEKAIGDFLSDRGFKKGMGVLDLYSTINAGQPGRYNASDNGGKDTVRSHTERILRDHSEKARQWIGSAGSAPRRWDKAALYAAIDAREDWSPERRERLRRMADDKVQTDEQLLSRQETDADRSAGEVALKLGENFKSTNQIPREVWNKMSIADRAKYEKAADDNASGKSVEADGPVATQYMLMRELEPEKFKQANLGALVGKMTPAELQQLAVDQAKMLKPSNNAGKPFDPSGGIREAINYGEGFKGVKLAPLLKVKVATYMASVLRDIHEKRPLTGADYDAAFNSAVRQTGSHGWIKADVLTDIPGSFRDKVMRNWKGQRPPTEDEIVTLYRRSLGG